MTTLSTALRHLARLYRALLLPAFTLALLLTMWTAVRYQVGQERLNAHEDAVMRSQSLARTLAEHTNHLLRQADHATQLFKLKFEESGGSLRLAEFSRKNGLLDSLMPSKLELPLALIDADGAVRDSLHGYFSPEQQALPFFASHRASDEDKALVSTPVVEPRTRKWMIQISRRLNHRDGSFAGAIVIMIDPATFVDDYDRMNVEDLGAVLLLNPATGQGVVRVNEHLFLSDTLDFAPPPSAAPGGDELLLRRPFDQVERIYGQRDMPRFGLMAVVGVTSQFALARFERLRRIYYSAVGAASLLVLAFAALLMQQAARLRRSMRAATEAQHMLRGAADASLDAFFLLRARHRYGKGRGPIDDFSFADLNERAAALLGQPRAALLERSLRAVLPQLLEHGYLEKYLQVMRSGQPLEEEIEVSLFPGPPRWLQHQIVAIDDGVAVTTRDIGQRKEAELAMRRNQAELAAVNDASPLGLLHTDPYGRCTYVNRSFELITGLSRDNALGDAWLNAVHPDDRPLLRSALQHLAETQQPFQNVLRCLRPDGRLLWISFKIAAMQVDGEIYGYVGTADDITMVRNSVHALRESEARLRTIADTLPAMVAYLDAGQVFRFHNLAYEREFGAAGQPLLGNALREVVGADRYARLRPYLERALAGETLRFEEDESGDGYERWYEVVYIPQKDENGEVVGCHVMRQDITAQKREKQHLLQLSQVDALTGLTNRAGFLHKLSTAMAYCREHGALMAVMYMDIDRFKPVNDTYGHAVGDALLKAFSARLSHTMRASDTIARLGGDEFTIITEHISKVDDAVRLASKIVAAMQPPFELGGVVVGISASVGVAFYRDEVLTPAELLHQADLLLYEAKQAGRNTYRCGIAQAPAAAPA